MSDLKQVAQLRKAIMPLVEVLKNEANKEFSKRLDAIEDSLAILAKRDMNIAVKSPDVTVTVETPREIQEAITKLKDATLEKRAEPSQILKYEPHDQAGGVVKYNGFIASDGSWYIQRLSKSQQRYAKGKGDYGEAWDKRGKLNYGYFDGEK